MNEKIKFNAHCDCCGWEFPVELLKNNESVLCKFCGTRIIKPVDFKHDFISEREEQKNKRYFFSRLYENLSNKKTPIDRVLCDSDFPLIFTENYIIVASRIIYFYFLEMKKDLEFNFQNGELTEEIVEILNKKIKPITEKRIEPKFLQNLNKISIKGFEKWLKFQQSKLEKNERFSNDFAFFLRWLIEKVFTIISELWDEEKLPKFDRIIRDDLKNFDSIVNNSNTSVSKRILKNVKEFSLNFKNSDILTEKVIEVYNDLINGLKRLKIEDLPTGFRSNPKYLVSSLIFFGLRHEGYNCNHPEYRFHGILDYIEINYPNDSTMKTAITNIVPQLYDYLSDSLKFKILYYPMKKHYVNKEIKEKVKNLKEKEEEAKFLSFLKSSIKKFSCNLPFPEKISKIALVILGDAIKSPIIFSYNEIVAKNIWFNSPEVFAVCLLFLGYHHNDYEATKLLKISEFSEKYFKEYKDSLQTNVSFIYKYLSAKVRDKIKYLPTQSRKSEHLDQFENSETWRILKNLFEIFNIENQEEYLKTAKQIFTLAKRNGYDSEEVTRPHYLACILLYFTLLKEEYPEVNKKKVLIKLKSTIYSIWDKGFYRATNEFGKYINVEHAIIKYDFHKFTQELLKIRKKYEKVNRPDNLILIDLILETITFCKSDFKDLIAKLALIIAKKRKPSAIIEKLSISNTFDKISKLEDFVDKYKILLEKLSITHSEKNRVKILINQFEKSKRDFYKFEEKKLEKIKKEKIRYEKYRKYFYSHKIRVKRFLLLLGFSPFDGFDIWDNKLIIKDKYRIYANFHHYHYTPEEQSENDLVFIPTRPPKKIRNGEYLTKNYLSHNSISGLEGNLKRNDISDETRTRIVEKLQEIESLIEFNSNLIEKAVYTQNDEKLHELKNWSVDDIRRAMTRLRDDTFSWAKGIEDYLPTADGYNRTRFDAEERESIVRGIINKRVKL